MKVKCPKCGTVYALPESAKEKEAIKLKCKKCATVFGVKIKKEVPPPEKKVVREEFKPDYVKILVAHESEDVASKMKEDLMRFGADVLLAKDGVEAIETMEAEKPHVAVLSVVLPRIFGYEVCELAKKRESLKDIKIILITSTYDTHRFRREPEDLYGADDYIDFPFETRALLEKIERLTGLRLIPPSQEVQQKEVKIPEKKKEVVEKPPFEKKISVEEGFSLEACDPQDRPEVEKAMRLARVIVSEINLYNPEQVERGIREGNFYELFEKDIAEGRKLYEQRVPPHIKEKYPDFLKIELEKFIAKKKKELGLM